MKQPTIYVAYYYVALILFYSVVKNVSVAPDIPVSQLPLPVTGVTKVIVGGKLTADFKPNCPAICQCGILEGRVIVNCSFRQMRNIPPGMHSSASELQLFKNKLTNLSYNSSLTKLVVLNASDNNISTINSGWLSTLVNLQSLDISNNELQSSSLESTFSNIPLRHLYLSHNKLREITGTMFIGIDLLQVLNLSCNEISVINDNSFLSFNSLETLDLSLNKLVNLKHEWFKSLKNLKTLILKENRINLLSNIVFWPLINLRHLDLSENIIDSVGLLSFKGLVNLEVLNVSNNNIRNMQDGIFRPLEHATVIDLSNNPIHTLDNIFKRAATVEVLNLRFLSNLKRLTSHSLWGLTNLEVLDLSSSHSLSHVSQHAFTTTKKLKSLDISNANVSTLKSGVFKGLTKIETINLKGNPWKCDCYVYWILLWLGENANAHLLSPSDTVCHSPHNLIGNVLLDALDHNMVCTNASIHQYTENAQYRVGSTALLQCQTNGSPLPTIAWITPQKFTFHWHGTQNSPAVENHSILALDHPEVHSDDLKLAENYSKEHFLLMRNGDLLIRSVERSDAGFYVCVASNPISNTSIAIRLTLDYGYLTHIKIVSILVGLATSFGFLLLTLISVLTKMILRQCGIKCPCRSGKSSPKSQQIRKILESMEHYKKQQLEKLRENYNFQVQRIKDNCMQQMERLRESYSSQSERLRDIRDYGTLQIDRIRENYYLQVQRVREYSASQIEKLRENYLFQRNRIRKFSANHLYKLRENYKLQQQHLNKILENLNIESCRNVCQRTDSIVFEPDITLENVFVPKICLAHSFSKHNSDSVDNSSQISAYFTPEDAGSEVSGHESDGQDSMINNLCAKASDSNPQLSTAVEMKNRPKEVISETTNGINDIQPDVVVFSNLKLAGVDSTETIV